MSYKLINKILGDPNAREVKRARVIVERINGLEETVRAMSDEELRGQTAALRARLAAKEKAAGEDKDAGADEAGGEDREADTGGSAGGGNSAGGGKSGNESLDSLLPEAFATVREAARRTIGQRHFDVQLVGGIVLHQHKIAEMRTGEGKTLVATAPTYLNALPGKGAHVVTVNDYLARLACGWMGKVFHALGMSAAVIVPDAVFGVQAFMYDPEFTGEEHDDDRLNHLRPISRAEAYAADITYGTNNEFGFDYLRDNMVNELGNMVQRPLYFAIVDEVDSVLIDEARTPLIISAPADEATDKYYEFAKLAATLRPEKHYTLDEKMKAASMTDDGIMAVEKALGVDNIYEAGRIDDVHHIENALRAVALYKRDRDYVVRDGSVVIVDEFTGRLMPGRRWSDGLHQAIEAKEGASIQQESMTLATITFQNYFRMYKKLSGMTGTASTEAEEFGKIYNLDVITIPTHQPMVRKDLPDRIYKTEEGKLRAVAKEVAERNLKGQPVLIGTVSIAKNELLAKYLEELEVPHHVLNAKNNESEAGTVAAAGRRGAVTLATNIAGRGTDIMLEDGVADLGGLHVIGTERHESRRIDNQLRGRAGRQGDPGSTQFYVSLEDDLMRIFGSDKIAGMLDSLGLDEETPIEHKFISKSLESAQKKVEGHNFDARKQVVDYDDVMNRHRETIYARRRRALAAESLREEFEVMIETQIKAMVRAHTNTATSEVDYDKLLEVMGGILPVSDELKSGLEHAHHTELVDIAMEEVKRLYDIRAEHFTPEMMRLVERFVYVSSMDRLWILHLDAMSDLREGIFLRSIGQRDPLVEYRREAYRMFGELVAMIEAEIASTIFRIQIAREEVPEETVVETALTRAAEKAVSNAPLEGETVGPVRGIAAAYGRHGGSGDGADGGAADSVARGRGTGAARGSDAAARQGGAGDGNVSAAEAAEIARRRAVDEGRSRAERRAVAKSPAIAAGSSATKRTNVKRKKKR